MSCQHWTGTEYAKATLYAGCPWCEIERLRNDLTACQLERDGMRKAIYQAIKGHRIWESLYGSSPDSRAHGVFLQTAFDGSPEPQTPEQT